MDYESLAFHFYDDFLKKRSSSSSFPSSLLKTETVSTPPQKKSKVKNLPSFQGIIKNVQISSPTIKKVLQDCNGKEQHSTNRDLDQHQKEIKDSDSTLKQSALLMNSDNFLEFLHNEFLVRPCFICNQRNSYLKVRSFLKRQYLY